MPLRRLQLLLDEDRYERVSAVARERQISVAAVIREAIDRGLPAPSRRRAAAAERILTADPSPVGEVDELVLELRELRGRRG